MTATKPKWQRASALVMRVPSYLRRILVASCLVGCLIAVVGYWLAKPLLFVEGGSREADVIIVLGGECADRVWRGVELFKSGAAPRILLSGNGDAEFIKNRLLLAGVPEKGIALESQSRNTKENAEYSCRWARAHKVRRAIVVTSWYHSRRALACFAAFGQGIEFSSRPAYHGLDMVSKPSEDEAVSVFCEYLKITWYCLRYGISPSLPTASVPT